MGDISWNDKRREGQRIDPRWKKEWPKFEKRCKKRLRKGHREYGDSSFDRPLSSLLEEKGEEIMDEILWAMIALAKNDEMIEEVKRMEEKVKKLEKLAEEGE